MTRTDTSGMVSSVHPDLFLGVNSAQALTSARLRSLTVDAELHHRFIHRRVSATRGSEAERSCRARSGGCGRESWILDHTQLSDPVPGLIS